MLRSLRAGVLSTTLLSTLLVATPWLAARAGTLEIFEASAGQGQVRTLPGPATDVLVDLDYAPITAEGGKLYGMSEVEIEATGNLVLTPTGFACQATSCLFSPSPFATGKKIRVTAGNDLAGETTASTNLLTIGITGTTGHIVLVRGEYLDGTGAGAKVGSVRTLDAKPLVTVPEPDPTAAAALGALLLALVRTARASARSGRAPCPRARRAR